MIAQHHLSLTDAEHIRNSLRDIIQSACLELSSSHNIDMTVVAILLTLYRDIDIVTCWNDLNWLLRHHEGELISSSRKISWIGDNDHMRTASHLWLCKTLAPDLEMDGSFFADRNVYTHLSLLYVRSIGRRPPDEIPGTSFARPPSTEWMQMISVILSKSAPSEELAAILTQTILRAKKRYLQGEEKKDVIRAILIYLFVSNYYVSIDTRN